MKAPRILIVALCVLSLFSCTESKQQKKSADASVSVNIASFGKGDVVPNDEVCMVNNVYMGRKQIEVMHNKKRYYGCCEKCEKMIPEDEGVRTAIDPFSNRPVDKAEAIIAITGEKGQISYFENKANYQAFFTNNRNNGK